MEKRIGDVVLNVTENVVSAVIDRPAAKNAINSGVIDGLAAAVDLAEEGHAKALIFRGAGGTFCSGADLREVDRIRADPGLVEKFMTRLGEVLDRIESASFPTVAVVEGYAVAGGCELLLACDVVIASTTARIGDRHVEYGLAPAAGGSVRLSRHLPKARANYLLVTGEMLSGEEAAAWGLATIAVEPDDVDMALREIARRLASRSVGALAATKRMIENSHRLPRGEALHLERAIFVRHLASDDAVEGLTAFRERRKPVFN